MDRYTVPMLLHENAIYMHEAQQYQVEKLDFDACKAFIRRVDVGYYTDANLNVTLSLLDKEKEEEQDGGLTALGEIRVSTLVTMFKKIRLDTHETLGFGHVWLPETEMHTTAMWWTLPDTLAARFESDTLKNGKMGVANLLRIVAPLSLMCRRCCSMTSSPAASDWSSWRMPCGSSCWSMRCKLCGTARAVRAVRGASGRWAKSARTAKRPPSPSWRR